MRLRRFLPEMITIAVVLVFIGLFLYTSSAVPGAGFAGTDTVASSRIAELTGNQEDNFTPLIPQWVPPSPEIESALFAIQASAGGICVGLVFGYWIGSRRRREPAH